MKRTADIVIEEVRKPKDSFRVDSYEDSSIRIGDWVVGYDLSRIRRVGAVKVETLKSILIDTGSGNFWCTGVTKAKRSEVF